MTRTIAIVLYAVAAALAIGFGRRNGSQLPTVEELLGRVMTTRTGRACSMLFWLWVGWHFFAR